MSIYIVIGQSASGKTTYVTKNFITEELQRLDKPFKHTISGKNLLLGHYGLERRCCGTDTMSMSILPFLIEHFKEVLNKSENIIGEGDRINNQKFFDYIKNLNIPVKVILFECSIEESLKRLKEAGSTIGETFVKTTKTKAKRMLNYARKLKFETEVINTDKEPQGLNKFFGGK